MMLRQGRRPPFDRHEQLSPPAVIQRNTTKPLSKSPSLTTPPCSNSTKKKKLLKVILNIPPHNPNPNPNPNPADLNPNPNSKPDPSPPPTPSSSSSSPASPLHHHLQLQHHQQLLQQHYQKQKLLQQQTQQLASELQFKLQQQQLQQIQLQQHHPELLEQLKQHLNLQPLSDPSLLNPESLAIIRSVNGEDRGGSQNPKSDLQGASEQHGSPQDEAENNPKGLRRRGRISHEFLLDDRRNPKRARIHGDGEDNFDDRQHGASAAAEKSSNPKGAENFKQGFLPNSNIQKANQCFNSRALGVASGEGTTSSSGLIRDAARTTEKPSNSTMRDAQKTQSAQQHLSEQDKGGGNSTPNSVQTRPAVTPESTVPAKKALRGVLDELQKKDRFGVFAEPVDPEEVPSYYDIIKEPMDFGTMRKRITAGYYTNLDLFEKDIFQICSNAMTFNATGTIYYKQARAIKVAAERILQALRVKHVAEGMAGEATNAQKTPVKKSHKKKPVVRTPMDNLEYTPEGAVDFSGRLASFTDTPSQPDNLRTSADNREDSSGYFGKSAGLNRSQVSDENRRNTFKPSTVQGNSPLVTPTAGNPLHFVPAAYQIQFSYARSLARFAADLGPAVWKVAANKIRRGLPPGIPFGPGWVGEPESLAGSSSPASKLQRPPNPDARVKEGEISGNVRMPRVPDPALKARDSSRIVDSNITVDKRSSNPEQNGVSAVPLHGNLDIRHQQASNMTPFSHQRHPERVREDIERLTQGAGGNVTLDARQFHQHGSNKMDLQPSLPQMSCPVPVGSTMTVPISNGTARSQAYGTSEGQESVMAQVSGMPQDSQNTTSLQKTKYLGPQENVKLIHT